MEKYRFIANGSEGFDKTKVLKGIDTSNRDKASDASMQNAFNTAFIWAGMICVIVIIISGLTFITAAGNPGTLSKAKSALIYACVGIIVILSAALIVNLIIGGILTGSV